MSCRIALQKPFVDLSWLPSNLIGPFYVTILLLVLRDLRCFTLVYFKNCALIISLVLSPLRQKCFTPCICSALFLCQSCCTTGLMFLRVFLSSRIGNGCAILLLKTLRMILRGLRAVKVSNSLHNWGYIASAWCASCPPGGDNRPLLFALRSG